jgi:hypothetical protein
MPGDTVFVREGVYSEIQTCSLCWGAVLQAVVSGTESSPIQFVAHPDETVSITDAAGADWGVLAIDTGSVVPRFVVFQGFEVRGGFDQGCITVGNTSDIVLSELEVTNCTESAVKLSGTTRVTLEGSVVHHNPLEGWTSALNLWQCNAGHEIRGNFIWANTDEDPRGSEGHGIIMIWGNEGWCITAYNSDGAVIRNNTCWLNGLGRVDGGGEVSIRGSYASVHNNILVSKDGAPALRIYHESSDFETIESDFNIIWSPYHDDVVVWPPYTTGTVAEYQAANGYGWGGSSLQVDPDLVDPPNGDFRLSNTSPAIDSAMESNAADDDVKGHARPFDGDSDGLPVSDRGAHEYGGIFVDGFEDGSTASWSDSVP